MSAERSSPAYPPAQRFRFAHATHPDWRTAVDLLDAQLQGQSVQPGFARDGNLGIIYACGKLAPRLAEMGRALRMRHPGTTWVGAGVHGVCSTAAEYIGEPAVAVMICALPTDSFRVFSELSAPGYDATEDADPGAGIAGSARFALVHADPAAAGLAERVSAGDRLGARWLFGGLVGGDEDPAVRLAGEQLLPGEAASQTAETPLKGVSGVIFGDAVSIRSRVTQGCSPLSREHRVTASRGNMISSLDGRPALDVLLEDLNVPAAARASTDGDAILRSLPAERLSRGLLVGLAPGETPRGFGFGDYVVRNLVGIDPARRLLAVAALPQPGERAVFCTRDQQAARADLIRICTELREEIESDSLRILGAHYVSCVARGENLFGSPGAELGLIAHNLGEVPLVGFFANGEIAGDRLYGYTGVLSLFVERRPGAQR
jgi:small ligand-binding sensory domain FIST